MCTAQSAKATERNYKFEQEQTQAELQRVRKENEATIAELQTAIDARNKSFPKTFTKNIKTVSGHGE